MSLARRGRCCCVTLSSDPGVQLRNLGKIPLNTDKILRFKGGISHDCSPHFSLQRCDLNKPVFEELGSLLRSGSSLLKSLSVGLNKVGDQGVKHLWEAVAHPNCLLEELE